jgi:hypothetical protein
VLLYYKEMSADCVMVDVSRVMFAGMHIGEKKKQLDGRVLEQGAV